MLEKFGNVMEMVKKIQQNVDSVQESLQTERIEVQSGDVIKVIINGQQEIVSVDINPNFMNVDNTSLIQALLVSTINNANEKSKELQQNALGNLTSDLNLPKIPGLF